MKKLLLLCVLCACDSQSTRIQTSKNIDPFQTFDRDINIIDQSIQDISIDLSMDQNLDLDMTPRQLDVNDIDDLIPLIAKNQCRLLKECCESQYINQYFFTIQNSTSYPDELKSKLPPNQPLGDDCEIVLTQTLTIAPFGDWVKGVKENLIEYLPDQARICLDQMGNAQCGLESYHALFDSQCFALAPPSGGENQRKAFDRKGRDGSPCYPIRDGIGSSFFGTCDPINAFCCIADEEGKCMPGGPEDQGICQAVSVIGEDCQTIPLQLCQTGLSCDPFSNKCIAEGNRPLMPSERCYENFNIIGECIDSYCDVSASNLCQPFIEDGQNCTDSFSCRTGSCNDGICGPILFCTGKE
jgi:hypothetical protein